MEREFIPLNNLDGCDLLLYAMPFYLFIYICTMMQNLRFKIVIPRFEKEGMKSPYMCSGYSNHTYSNNMITRIHVQ
jgi:hypothetical protein